MPKVLSVTNELTVRDQLIERILHIPEEQVIVVNDFLETLATDPTWSDEGISAAELERRNWIDQAAIDASRGEPGRPLEEVLQELGIE